MINSRFEVFNKNFHELCIRDNQTSKEYGCFTRFEREQLEKLCTDLNNEQENTTNIIKTAIRTERTCLGRNVLMQLADNLEVNIE